MCHGSCEQNVRYCKKGEQPKAEWEELKELGPNYGKNAVVWEHGEPPMSQKRKGEEGKAAALEKKRRLNELVLNYDYATIQEEYPHEFLVHSGHMRRVQEQAIGHITKDLAGPCGLWLYGLSNAGKSHKARAMFPGAFSKEATKWWCGYRGQEVVIIDDVDHKNAVELRDHLKIWADKYPFNCQTKGGSFTMIRPRKVIVTSQYDIDTIWHDEETRAAMRRRFKQVLVVEDPDRPKPRNVNDLSDDELQAWDSIPTVEMGEEEEQEI